MKKYNIIYADPPWKIKEKHEWAKGNTRSPNNHYEVMSLDRLIKLPISELADENCTLFMWVINPLLHKSFEVIKSWGFTYKTVGFTWVKKNRKTDSWFWGLGYYTRANAELCLIATKGKPQRVSRGIHSLVETKIENHSKKPDVVRERIVSLCGDIPRIELFARQKVDGWDSWGNEIISDISL